MCACVRACVFAMFKLSILMHFKNRQNLYNKIILQGVSMTRKKIQWMDITVVHCLCLWRRPPNARSNQIQGMFLYYPIINIHKELEDMAGCCYSQMCSTTLLLTQTPTAANNWFSQPTRRLATDERSSDDVHLVAFVTVILRRGHKRCCRQISVWALDTAGGVPQSISVRSVYKHVL